jgi:hypothetical protein
MFLEALVPFPMCLSFALFPFPARFIISSYCPSIQYRIVFFGSFQLCICYSNTRVTCCGNFSSSTSQEADCKKIEILTILY